MAHVSGFHVAARLILFVTAVSASQTVLAQPAPKTIDLGMPTPHLFPTSTGDKLVCAQWFPENFTYREETFPAATMRVAVVDLTKQERICVRDFPAVPMRLAVAKDRVYFVDFERQRIAALSLTDLQEQAAVAMPSKPMNFVVIADRLLCSEDGLIRLDLPDLKSSTLWAAQPMTTLKYGQRTELPRGNRWMLGGWLIDGVLYDRELQGAIWAPHHNITSFDPLTISNESAATQAQFPSLKEGVSLGALIHPEDRLAAEITMPPTQGNVDVPVTIRMKRFDEDRIESRTMGVIPSDMVVSRGAGRYWWDSKKRVNGPNPLHAGSTATSFSGWTDLVTMTWAGHRLCVVVYGKLATWQPDEALLGGLTRHADLPVHPALPLVTVEFDRLNEIPLERAAGIGTLSYELNEPKSPVIDGGETLSILAAENVLRFHPAKYFQTLQNQSISQVLELMELSSEAQLKSYLESSVPVVQRMLGRPPRGVPLWLPFSFYSQEEMPPSRQFRTQLYVMIELPNAAVEQTVAQWQALADQERQRRQEFAMAEQAREESARQAERLVQQQASAQQAPLVQQAVKARQVDQRLTALQQVLRGIRNICIPLGLLMVMVAGVIKLFGKRAPEPPAKKASARKPAARNKLRKPESLDDYLEK